MKSLHKFISILFTVVAGVCIAKAQTKPLSIGMQMPDLTFTKTINFQPSNLKIADFKGKLLILDFWATWCSPCVSEIPKMQALQKAFKDSVIFLPVTYQDRQIVSPFVEKLLGTEHIKFRSILSDTVLNRLFPHTSIPFFVWVDRKGKIMQTTDATQITVSNIKEALSGRAAATVRPMRNYRMVDYKDIIYPATIAYEANDKEGSKAMELISPGDVLFNSILTKYNPNLAGKLHYDSAHFVCVNTPIINFYRDYYGSWIYKKYPFIFWSAARCKVEISDSLLYNQITSDKSGAEYVKWSETNAYCYELNWKNCKTWEEKFALLKSDLDRYFGDRFGIEAVIEQRTVPSDVLIQIPHSKSITTSNKPLFEEHDALSYRQVGAPISQLINRLQGYYWQTSDRPVFDESGLTGRFDLKLECDMNNIMKVNAELKKYGLMFISADRLAEVLVIRKKDLKRKSSD